MGEEYLQAFGEASQELNPADVEVEYRKKYGNEDPEEERIRTIPGQLLNATRSWQFYRNPFTKKISEQDYVVGVDPYVTWLDPQFDLLWLLGYGGGATPFILGTLSGPYYAELKAKNKVAKITYECKEEFKDIRKQALKDSLKADYYANGEKYVNELEDMKNKVKDLKEFVSLPYICNDVDETAKYIISKYAKI